MDMQESPPIKKGYTAPINLANAQNGTSADSYEENGMEHIPENYKPTIKDFRKAYLKLVEDKVTGDDDAA